LQGVAMLIKPSGQINGSTTVTWGKP
jgi:hypothetical protein